MLQIPGPARHTHLCSKLELVQPLADLVQVVVLLLRLRLQHSRLLAVPDVCQPACADPRVGVLARARLAAVALHAAVLLLLLLHGLLVWRGHARVIARATTANRFGARDSAAQRRARQAAAHLLVRQPRPTHTCCVTLWG